MSEAEEASRWLLASGLKLSALELHFELETQGKEVPTELQRFVESISPTSAESLPTTTECLVSAVAERDETIAVLRHRIRTLEVDEETEDIADGVAQGQGQGQGIPTTLERQILNSAVESYLKHFYPISAVTFTSETGACSTTAPSLLSLLRRAPAVGNSEEELAEVTRQRDELKEQLKIKELEERKQRSARRPAVPAANKAMALAPVEAPLTEVGASEICSNLAHLLPHVALPARRHAIPIVASLLRSKSLSDSMRAELTTLLLRVSPRPSIRVREETVTSLDRLLTNGVKLNLGDPLLELMASPTPQLRMLSATAIFALRRRLCANVVEKAFGALTDADDGVRACAVNALARDVEEIPAPCLDTLMTTLFDDLADDVSLEVVGATRALVAALLERGAVHGDEFLRSFFDFCTRFFLTAPICMHSLEHVQCVLSLVELAAEHLYAVERLAERIAELVFAMARVATDGCRPRLLRILSAFSTRFASASPPLCRGRLVFCYDSEARLSAKAELLEPMEYEVARVRVHLCAAVRVSSPSDCEAWYRELFNSAQQAYGAQGSGIVCEAAEVMVAAGVEEVTNVLLEDLDTSSNLAFEVGVALISVDRVRSGLARILQGSRAGAAAALLRVLAKSSSDGITRAFVIGEIGRLSVPLLKGTAEEVEACIDALMAVLRAVVNLHFMGDVAPAEVDELRTVLSKLLEADWVEEPQREMLIMMERETRSPS